MANEFVYRFLWCELCHKITYQVVAYSGNYTIEKKMYVDFYSACTICSEIDKPKTIKNTVPVADWNALISKEIYT